jgi:hypothetical protein
VAAASRLPLSLSWHSEMMSVCSMGPAHAGRLTTLVAGEQQCCCQCLRLYLVAHVGQRGRLCNYA